MIDGSSPKSNAIFVAQVLNGQIENRLVSHALGRGAVTESPNESWLKELIARAEAILQSAESFPHLVALGRLFSIQAGAERRRRICAYINSHHAELIAESRGLGIESTPVETDPAEWDDSAPWPDSGQLDEAKFAPRDPMEAIIEANRARAYIDSTF